MCVGDSWMVALNVTIRPFRLSDLSQVMSLIRISFPTLNPYDFLIILVFGKIWDRIYWAIRTLSFHSLFRSNYERCHFIAEIEGSRIVGFVLTRYWGRHLLDTWKLRLLCVNPNYRRLGIGTMLTKSVISFVKHKKAKLLFLTVDRNNVAAMKLYQKMGFMFSKSQHPHYMFLSLDYTAFMDEPLHKRSSKKYAS